MSEHPSPDTQPTPAAPASVDVSALRTAGRRRFLLKAGGVAVPTALTLASRPVMAWDCNTASTWGSAQGVANTSYSSYTRSRRINISLYADETYTKANWVNNTTRANLTLPWTAIGCNQWYWPWNNFKNLQLCHITSCAINGVSSTKPIWDILTSTNDEYCALMVVAWLNYVAAQKTGATPGLTKCLAPQPNTNALVAFGNPGFKGADGQIWDKARIVRYLKSNYIAVMS